MSSPSVALEPRPSELMQALARVKGNLPPIEKRGYNDQISQHYATLGDIYNALRPLLAAEGVVEFPEVGDIKAAPGKTGSGKETTRYSLAVDWHFVHGPSGEERIFTIPAESVDNLDKGIQKAVSASHRVLLMTMFEIGGEDVDAPPEGEGKPRQRQQQNAGRNAAPQGERRSVACELVAVSETKNKDGHWIKYKAAPEADAEVCLCKKKELAEKLTAAGAGVRCTLKLFKMPGWRFAELDAVELSAADGITDNDLPPNMRG